MENSLQFRIAGAEGPLILAFGLLAACGSTDSQPVAPCELGSGTQFSVAGALKQIPAVVAAGDDGNVEIYVADLVAAGEATGRSRPTGSTDIDKLR